MYADYLRSHFSFSPPKLLRAEAEAPCTRFDGPGALRSLISLSALPFTKFLACATNLSSSTVTGSDKVAYPMLKHLPCFSMGFYLF